MGDADRPHGRIKQVSVVLLVCVLITAATGSAAAATNTSVTLTPENDAVTVGETVTVDVVVDNVENGIDSYEFTTRVGNASVAKITNVTLQGTSADDTLTSVEYSDNGSSVAVSAGLADHDNGVIASITLQATGTGATELLGESISVGDTDSNSYSIDSIDSSTVTVQGQSTDLTIQPKTRTIADGGTATVDIVAPSADSGVGSYEFNASVVDPSVATIEDVTLVGTEKSNSLTSVTISEDGAAISVVVGDGTDDNGRIATLQLNGQSLGSTEISIVDAAIGDTNSNSYQLSSLDNSTVQVQEPPGSVVGESNPTDIDQDGTYEDVNGDGKFDIVDVSAIFQNRDKQAIRQSERFYDYNGDGKFNIVDIAALLNQTSSSRT